MTQTKPYYRGTTGKFKEGQKVTLKSGYSGIIEGEYEDDLWEVRLESGSIVASSYEIVSVPLESDESPVGPVISSYSRANAIADGTLIDLNQLIPVAESGYKYPVACTASVFALITRAIEKYSYMDEKGITWDILWMSRMYPTKKWETGRLFKVKIGSTVHTLKLEAGPGDNGEGVITIMTPEED
ncbi:MAG: hypothetical protein HPY53_01705 [Brevinematales bacterium]|nr:hypothetical protein [Brevinematales bacterium]